MTKSRPRSASRPISSETARAEAKQRFLAALAETSHVARSAEMAGLSTSAVYEWRKADPQFYADWMQALKIGYELLEMELLERARNGTDKTVFSGGQEVKTVKEYDNRLALQILAQHRDNVAAMRAVQDELSNDSDIKERLARKLTEMNRLFDSGNGEQGNKGKEAAGGGA